MPGLEKVTVTPRGAMEILSKDEIARLTDKGLKHLHDTLRLCSLAVLNWGQDSDNTIEILDKHKNYHINLVQTQRGIALELFNPPKNAFVDGEIINGVRELLFSIVRDVIFTHAELIRPCDGETSEMHSTNLVFHVMRNAKSLIPHVLPNMVVCWGGHSISRVEYDYTKEVGYELGLRELDICTGCGPGAMKGPMKGAAVGHGKQRLYRGRYLGITEPGIIAAESPNPIVNELVVLPDIEKRLEAFVRTGHAFIVFPGGVGTAEEILYLLGILMHPDNDDIPFPLVWTGPVSAKEYFKQIDDFIGKTLGTKAQAKYEILIDDPERVARQVKQGVHQVTEYRKSTNDAYYFNWGINIDPSFQEPFEASHANMRSLNLTFDQPTYQLAANLRRAFSGLVAGNVKPDGIRAIAEHGPFEIKGDPKIMKMLDKLLATFVKQNRMKLPGSGYHPCYKIVKK